MVSDTGSISGVKNSTEAGVSVVGSAHPLKGRSVLVVEDEPLIELDLHQALSSAGASVLAATSLKDALELIACADIAAAVLDVNLGSSDCLTACAALQRRGIPFMFYTGYTKAYVHDAWPDAPSIGKPANLDDVVRTVLTLIAHDTPNIPSVGAGHERRKGPVEPHVD